jgi:hypothetical protein
MQAEGASGNAVGLRSVVVSSKPLFSEFHEPCGVNRICLASRVALPQMYL